jgi:plastocyanin
MNRRTTTLAVPVPERPHARRFARVASLALLAGCLLAPHAAHARIDLLKESGIIKLDPETEKATSRPGRPNDPLAQEDIFGPGSVLSVGNIQMKVINNATIGNPFTNTSSDPSGQWPGASGVEYLNAIVLAVGAVNPTATDPVSIRRVSYFREWRPPTLDPEDKIYRAYDGIVNGTRFVNDDGDNDPFTGDPKIDEDFLDGRDNDGDGRIDEDYGAVGQQMYSFVMRDDTREAVNTTFNEKHVPLGLECRVRSWAYSIAGFQDFNVIEYQIRNVSGHSLDSLTIGWLIDMDAGPVQSSNYFLDDFDLPQYPHGEFTIKVGPNTGDLPDPNRRQFPHATTLDGVVSKDSALCPRVTLRINGFSTTDDNGDEGKTKGIGSFLLIDHTTDPTGVLAPSRVGFRAFRSFTAGSPYQQGGNPRVDQERFEFMTGTDNIQQDPNSPDFGFITLNTGETKGDYVQWCSIGPWVSVANGQTVSATIAFAVKEGSFQKAGKYSQDYQRYFLNRFDPAATYGVGNLMTDYPSLANAITAQIAFEGIHEVREGFPKTDFHGRETGIRLPKGSPPTTIVEDCSEKRPGGERREVLVNDREYSWFDFDCDYCTGVYSTVLNGLFHKTWNAAAPPPSPTTNVSTGYNFTDNPDRHIVAAGDRKITLSWDNASETTADPKSRWLDFRGYSIWKVSDWTRPVGSPGPAETDWRLLGDFRLFDYYTRDDANGVPIERNYTRSATGVKQCPLIYVPAPTDTVCTDPVTGAPTGCYRPICLDRGDLWNKQSGQIMRPDWTVPCATDTTLPVVINSGVIEFKDGSFRQTFPDTGDFAYLCLQHPQQKGKVIVMPGASDSVVVTIQDATPSGFLPNVAVIRPGGAVRWVNSSDQNHSVASDRACLVTVGCIVHRPTCDDPKNQHAVAKFPVGRYRYVDNEVKNGFTYFYSVTAFDSTTDNSVTTELSGRRSAAEAEGVTPQVTVNANGPNGVWVVPNPYRGYARIQERPSTWDLTPNASDPTGTHIDFFGLPSGKWTIRIYTVSGDLVQELHSGDPVNDSVRGTVQIGNNTYHGYNRQQDNPNDGQARWNLISRNGQDIVSGIYLFTVDSDQGSQRGRFVVIR